MSNSQGKRWRLILTSLGVAAILGLCGYLVFWVVQLSFQKLEALEVIPNNSAFVVEMKYPSFQDTSSYLPQLQNAPYADDVEALSFVAQAVDKWSLLQPLRQQIEYFSPSRLTIAGQIGANNQIDHIFILDNCALSPNLKQMLQPKAKKDAKTSDKDLQEDSQEDSQEDLQQGFQQKTFNQVNYYQYQLSDTVRQYIGQINNLLILTTSPVLMENAIAQSQVFATSITEQKSFQNIRELTGKNADLSIYLNMEYLPVFASFFANKRAIQSINYLNFFADWIGFDLQFQDKQISLSGYLSPSKNNRLLKAIKQQQLPDRTLIASVLPDNTAAMTYIGYKQMKAFYRSMDFSAYPDFEQFFIPWMGEEMAYLITEPDATDYEDHQFAIFRVRDAENARQYLEAFGQRFGEGAPEQYFNYNIKRVMKRDLLKPIWGNGLNAIHNPFYVVLEDYVVFANSSKALKALLDKYTYGQTLGEDVNYLQFVENLSATSSMYFYINTTNTLYILTALFKEKLAANIEEQFEYYQKITPIGIQLTPYKDLFVLNAKLQYNAKGKQATSVIWKSNLAANAVIAPKLVVNHRSKELEVFIQDDSNYVYLLNRNGERLWRSRIDGRIISHIHQIDFFKNTYLQYLFNTREKIYLMDRNGEMVQNFPITLNSPITNGVMIADYDSTRDYRYFVACADGKIYGFRKAGELLEGWAGKDAKGVVRFPLQHFSKENKDYIVVLNDWGLMSFFQRDGTTRMPAVNFKTEYLSTFGYDLSEPQRVVLTNEKGKAYILNFKGEYFNLGMNVDNNKNIRFEYADVLSDQRKDYITLGKNEIAVFSYTKDYEFKRFAKRTFDAPQDTLFQVHFIDRPKALIGTLSSSARQATLINGRARLYPDFPIPATTPFEVGDLFDDGKNVLVVGYDNAVFAYKLKQVSGF